MVELNASKANVIATLKESTLATSQHNAIMKTITIAMCT